MAAGATYIETDVHGSADGVAVISHDPDLTRVAGRDVRVNQLTMAELRKVELGSGQHFCSLAEVLEALPDAFFNIDIKSSDAILPTIGAVTSAGAASRVLVTSFSDERRRATIAGLPGVVTSASARSFISALIWAKLGVQFMVTRALRDLDAVQVPQRAYGIRVITAHTVRAFHAAHVEVHAWTINDPVEMSRLFDLGVDGIITDRVDMGLNLLKERAASRT
ncbi:MAG: glycerophosphodiester phosphodiesterase [Microbacteriaceae bacterium]|nr:glycerophosphodiester phosphodiesterase [Microbacteriaceae bacterium]